MIGRLLGAGLIALVHGYQALLRPILPAVCRFEPSCSDYFILAVRKYGPLRGAAKGAWRVCRCNPFCRGGYDPP
jgi:putative membrane protein insertion efficiency factor